LGVWILCPEDSLDIPKSLTIHNDSEHYDLIWTLLGVSEGVELNDKLPLNYNLHMLNGISFKKGCYIGHELT